MKIEQYPVKISTVARLFNIKPKTLYYWYRNYLSNYKEDIENKKWHPKQLEIIDKDTEEITKGKPLYVFKPDQIGENMSIDDKVIGHEVFTILSNNDTNKIAMMIESCKSEEISEAISLFGSNLQKVRSISCDMSAGYLKVCNNQFTEAKIVIDKFHVMQYVYDAVMNVQSRIKKELLSQLSKSKTKNEEDKIILAKLDLLKHCRHKLTQSIDKWTQSNQEIINQVFENHHELKIAYNLAQSFKHWYSIKNMLNQKIENINELDKWYLNVKNSNIQEFIPVVKLIRKHENEIINYFICAHTNAKAERINGNINRFISNNYGIRDKDFALYRIAQYF